MHSTRISIYPALLTVLAALLVFARPVHAVDLAPGDMAPGFVLKDIDGRSVTLEEYRGKTVVIAFWSTWCSRCEEEIEFLRDNLGWRTDVAVLLINQDSERAVPLARIREMRESLGVQFPVLIDEGLALWERYGINALPTSVVIDKNGTVKLIEPNFYWASPERLLSAVGQS